MLAEQIGPVFIVTITEASWSILRSCRWSRSSGRSSLSSWSRSPVGQSGRDHQGLVFCAERVRLAATVVDDAKGIKLQDHHLAMILINRGTCTFGPSE
jgi:hypothetical protein